MNWIKRLTLAALFCVGSASQATVYDFTFTDSSSNVLSSGRIFASSTPNSVGGYDVQSITGTVTNHGAITGLVANPNQPNSNTTPAYPGISFTYNNVLFAGTPAVDSGGILFNAGSTTWNIYDVGGTDYFSGTDGSVGLPPYPDPGPAGTFSVKAIPEKTYNWKFTDTNSAILSSGQITVLDELNASGGYDVVSITGSVAGYGAITDMVPNPNQPDPSTTPAYPGISFTYDNVLFTAYPHVDSGGILFDAGTTTWNIYDVGGIDYFSGTDGNVGFPPYPDPGPAGIFSIEEIPAAVPETASWMMFVGGFGLSGAAIRRRSRMPAC